MLILYIERFWKLANISEQGNFETWSLGNLVGLVAWQAHGASGWNRE